MITDSDVLLNQYICRDTKTFTQFPNHRNSKGANSVQDFSHSAISPFRPDDDWRIR